MSKVKSIQEALANLRDGMTIMVAGFLACGTPEALVDGIVESRVRNLTLICNDTAFPGRGVGKLFSSKQVKKLICCYLGTNKESVEQKNSGEIEVELVPQGTLIERIRCGGMGLGGFLTPTGVGTVVEDGKQKMTVGGREYLLELPLTADIALVKAWKADEFGNLTYRKAARNYNPIVAMAAEYVVAEADEISPEPLDPNEVMTPGVLVDALVLGGVSR